MNHEGTIPRSVVLAAIFLSCGALLLMAASSGAKEGKPVQQVRVTDIPDRVQLIGRLGHPLGELINISGKWVGPTGVAKDASLHFRVFKVNGKQLKVPVDFFDWAVTPIDSKPPQPKEGDTWDLRGVEIGGFREVPNQLRRERYGLKGEGDSPVQQQYGFEFITEFVYLPPAEDEQK